MALTASRSDTTSSKPANLQMEPTRRLCRAIMWLRRAAHLERYGAT